MTYKKRDSAKQVIPRLCQRISASMRVSKRGVPYCIKNAKGMTYSVTYFQSTGMFKVFWPYGDFSKPQEKKHVGNDIEDVAKFFNLL